MYKHIHFFQFLLIISSLWLLSSSFASDSEKIEKRGLNWKGPASIDANKLSLGTFRAVIVGNNDYQDEKSVWNNLSTAVNDAKTVANLLQNEYGFEDVTLLKNADRKTILGELKSLSARINPSDNVLVYYAGHGHIDNDEKRGYWVPTDGQGFDDTTFIRNSTIRDEINIIAEKTKHTLLVSDSCFSGSLLRGGNRGPASFQPGSTQPTSGYYTKVGNKKSVQVLTAGGKEYVDDDYRKSGHSPFTYFFINELKSNTQKYVSLSEIATNVIKAVANNVEQTPESGVLAGAGDELGEFIFARVSYQDDVIEVFAGRDVSLQKIRKNNESNYQASPAAMLPSFRF